MNSAFRPRRLLGQGSAVFSRRWVLAQGGLGVLFGTAACGGLPGLPSGGTGQSEASYATAADLADLVAKSDLIVLGTVSAKGEIINGARDPNDITKPDPNYFSLSQLYQVTVDRYLKGVGEPVLPVGQTEGALSAPVPFTPDNYDQARARIHHVPMQPETKYLMFLRRVEIQRRPLLAGTREPWRFALGADGNAAAESPWSGARGRFPARPTAALVGEVEQLINARPGAKPSAPPPKP